MTTHSEKTVDFGNGFHVQNKRSNFLKKDATYFQGHVGCTQESLKAEKYKLKCSSCMRNILYFTAVDKSDVRARNVFKSHIALQQEIYRHHAYYPLAIHPYSRLRFWLEGFTVVNLLLLNTFVTIQYCENIIFGKNSTLLVILSISECFYVLIIISNFFTGYVEGITSKTIILEWNKIVCRYLKTYFLIDVASVSGLFHYNQQFIMDREKSTAVKWAVACDSLKFLRTRTLYLFAKNFMDVKQIGPRKKIAIKIGILLYSYVQWNVFFQFGVEYFLEGSYAPANPRRCSWMTNNKMWNATFYSRFTHALERAVAMLRENSSISLYHTLKRHDCIEYLLVIAWFVAKILTLHCAFIYMITAFGLESARAKYYIMAHQVQTFMEQRKFPPRLKKKILKFYAIRFQSNFFVEPRMISCMSGQLREDIIMHSGRQLISDVEFLKNLPRSLHLQIGIELSVVIFIAGDIILKINTTGDCMYFIDRGTVAIYSESGKEVCHLQDGDFFGEIALVMKHRFRTASVVAVSNCELFRLDRSDFESSIATYPTVYEEIKRVALNRFERTKVMDDNYKSEVKDILRSEKLNNL